jgi:TolB-like protein
VLYLANLSRDTADAFLADGLTEEIIIRLGQVPRLAVKSRFEVERFRGRAAAQDPSAVGRALQVAYLVFGSVQRAGDRVRLRYEVIRAATRAQVAGDVIDRASGDLLTVESDIAGAVATAITGQVLPDERARLSRPVTSDPVAYEQYLRGLQAAHNFGDEAALRSAVAYFDRAIARDSGFASAFAGKAVAWSMLADGYVTPREGYGQTRVAANQALALDSSQALAWDILANAVFALDLDARESERLARRGVALDPRGGWSHLFLSGALWAEGKTDSAIAEARRAWQDDSLFTIMSVNYISMLVGTGRLDTAAAMIPRIRAILSPTDADPLAGMVLGARGDWRGAARLLGWRYYGGMYDAGMYVRALLALGDTVAARATVDSMVAARTPGYYNPVALARAYAALGDIDRGIEWLSRAFEERTVYVTWVRQDPGLAPLRADPRYAALDRQLRF